MRDRNDPGNVSPIPFGERRSKTNGTNGVRPEGMTTVPVDLNDVGEPIDLVAVQADDELINALAVGMTVSAPGIHGYDADDHVAAILAAWRAEVDAEPIPELVDLDTAIATVLAANRSRARSGRIRHLAPVAAAAALVVIVAGGVSFGSATAKPDSILWPMSKVLFSERAASVEAAVRISDKIENAKQALMQGQPTLAAQELAQAGQELSAVRPEEGQAQLASVQSFLVAKALETPPGTPVNPASPLRTDRSRPVPAGAAISENPITEGTVVPSPSGVVLPTTSPLAVDPTTSPSAGSGVTDPATSPAAVSPTQDPAPTTMPSSTPTAEGVPDGGTATSTSGMGSPEPSSSTSGTS